MRFDRFIRLVAVVSLVVVAWPSADLRAEKTGNCLSSPNNACCYNCQSLVPGPCPPAAGQCSMSPFRWPD